MNINTKDYWERRFAAGDWEAKGGALQTSCFAETLVQYLKVPSSFSGRILDFGCGLGDAMPVYRKRYRLASLIGVDISQAAIQKCDARYGDIAEFLQCDYTQVPEADVIISCAVFEHMADQFEVARHLLRKCSDLYIIVPYKEVLFPGTEHVNSYDEASFAELGECDSLVFASRGWSEYGLRLWFDVYLKNLLRPFFARKILHRKRMIMFHLAGEMRRSHDVCQKSIA